MHSCRVRDGVVESSSVVLLLPCLVTFFTNPSLHALSFLNDFSKTFIIQCAITLQNIYYHLNGIHPTIQFIVEEKEKVLLFLDTKSI